mgnify:CR=1 FL=1
MGPAATPAAATGIEIDVAGEANGTIQIDLFEDVAPQHVERITTLAEQGAYDGVVFHRVIDGFMAQTGDVQYGRADGDVSRAGDCARRRGPRRRRERRTRRRRILCDESDLRPSARFHRSFLPARARAGTRTPRQHRLPAALAQQVWLSRIAALSQ